MDKKSPKYNKKTGEKNINKYLPIDPKVVLSFDMKIFLILRKKKLEDR